MGKINFEIELIDFNILLYQWTRVSKLCIEPEDTAKKVKAEEKKVLRNTINIDSYRNITMYNGLNLIFRYVYNILNHRKR